MQSTLSNSNSLGNRKNVRLAKSSNYRDSNDRGFLVGDFEGNCKFCLKIALIRIRQSQLQLLLS